MQKCAHAYILITEICSQWYFCICCRKRLRNHEYRRCPSETSYVHVFSGRGTYFKIKYGVFKVNKHSFVLFIGSVFAEPSDKHNGPIIMTCNKKFIP